MLRGGQPSHSRLILRRSLMMKAGIIRPKSTSDMALLPVRRSTGLSFWISLFLLLVFIQMFTSLLLYAGVFIQSNKVLISPFRFCRKHQYGELSCNSSPVSAAEIKINIFVNMVILALYAPVVLVAFALLAMLLAAYAKDRGAHWFSMACQAVSSILILTGIVGFLLLNQSYVSWEHMTIWFYICVGVLVELLIITALTRVSQRRLPSDWK